MTYELSTNVVKIDLKDIFDNVLNKQYWEKTWCIFHYNNVTIVIHLGGINILRNRVSIILKVTNELDDDPWNRVASSTAEFPLDRFELNIFTQSIMSEIHACIRQLERIYARKTSGYRDLVDEEVEFAEQSKLKREEKLDELGIEDEEIREVYIEAYETISLTPEYVKNFEDKYMISVHNQVDAMVEFVGSDKG